MPTWMRAAGHRRANRGAALPMVVLATSLAALLMMSARASLWTRQQILAQAVDRPWDGELLHEIANASLRAWHQSECPGVQLAAGGSWGARLEAGPLPPAPRRADGQAAGEQPPHPCAYSPRRLQLQVRIQGDGAAREIRLEEVWARVSPRSVALLGWRRRPDEA